MSSSWLALALTGRRSASPRMLAAPLVVPSSAVAAELSHRTVTDLTYAGVALASHDVSTRGKVLKHYARAWDTEQHPEAVFEDAVPGEDVSGRRRAQNQAPYDWLRDGKRVACKSAQLAWKANDKRWKLYFSAIKLDACDELLLAVYTPGGLHLFRYAGGAGQSTHGKSTATTGKVVTFTGPRHEPDWRAALSHILENMEAKGSRLLAVVQWDTK